MSGSFSGHGPWKAAFGLGGEPEQRRFIARQRIVGRRVETAKDQRRRRPVHARDRKAKLKSAILHAFGRASQAAPWNTEESIREELFSIERLEQHAESLAAAQSITGRPIAGRSLAARLKDNASVLLDAYHNIADGVDVGRAITPAAE